MKKAVTFLIALIAGGIAAYAVLLVIGGAVLGILWLYVFGDDPWPIWSDYVLGTAIVLGGLAAWGFFGWTIYRYLRRPA